MALLLCMKDCLVMMIIQETCHYVSLNEQEFVYSLQEESAMKDIAISETVKNRIERNQKRVHELDMLIRKIYEDNVIGRLPDRLFQSMLTDYENEQIEKETIVLFNEGEDKANIYTHNAGLKKRLAAFAKKYPDLCRLEKSNVQGGVSYELAKSRLSIRFLSPYSEQRRQKASEYAKKHGLNSQQG